MQRDNLEQQRSSEVMIGGDPYDLNSEAVKSLIKDLKTDFKDMFHVFNPKKTFKHAQFIKRVYVVFRAPIATIPFVSVEAKIQTRPLFKRDKFVYKPPLMKRSALTFHPSTGLVSIKNGDGDNILMDMRSIRSNYEKLITDSVEALQKADPIGAIVVDANNEDAKTSTATFQLNDKLTNFISKMYMNTTTKQVARMAAIASYRQIYEYCLKDRYCASVVRYIESQQIYFAMTLIVKRVYA